MENGRHLFLNDFAFTFFCKDHACHKVDINPGTFKTGRVEHFAVKKIFTVGMIKSGRIYDEAVNLGKLRVRKDILLDVADHWLHSPGYSSSKLCEELVRIKLMPWFFGFPPVFRRPQRVPWCCVVRVGIISEEGKITVVDGLEQGNRIASSAQVLDGCG